MISILICSRVAGNKNSGLPRLLNSLEKMSHDYKNFEVLIKFDTDDKKARSLLPTLKNYPFVIKYLVEPRGRGYIDLHVGYNRLLSLIDRRSTVVGGASDDFEITYPDWDEAILDKARTFEDNIFVIHCRPHPPTTRPNYDEQKFYLDFDLAALFSEDPKITEGFVADESSFWGKKLLDICGGLSHYAEPADAWTLHLEYVLWHRYSINRTLFLERPWLERKYDRMLDGRLGHRWYTERRYNQTLLRSRFYHTYLEHQALNVYLNIRSDLRIPEDISNENAPTVALFDGRNYRRERNSYVRQYYLWKFLRKTFGRRRASRILGWASDSLLKNREANRTRANNSAAPSSNNT
jgi:hypothetical protein